MGMAASQARFLSLTARKNNVEYEGQQINQQRIALSNQSANYNKESLNMEVPRVPSVTAYTKTVYSWTSSDGKTNTIDQIYPETKKVQYTHSDTVTGAYVSNSRARIKREEMADADGNKYYIYKDSNNDELMLEKNPATVAELRLFTGKEDEEFFESNGVYYSKTELEDPNNPNWTSLNNISTNQFAIGTTTKDVTEVANAEVNIAPDGKLASIKINGQSFSLKANSIKDEAAFEDAMNQYEYDKSVYDKRMEDINSKLSIVQAQDKQLELQLKQLDTEQEAIQTETDSVKKVIDKNIEGGFKAFG